MSGHPMYPDPYDPVETPATRHELIALLAQFVAVMSDWHCPCENCAFIGRAADVVHAEQFVKAAQDA